MHIVDHCCGLGGGLSPGNRALLETMLSGGDTFSWQKAKSIVISPLPLMTLGMAITRLQHALIPPEDVPDPFTVYRALRYSVSKRAQFRAQPEAFDIET